MKQKYSTMEKMSQTRKRDTSFEVITFDNNKLINTDIMLSKK